MTLVGASRYILRQFRQSDAINGILTALTEQDSCDANGVCAAYIRRTQTPQTVTHRSHPKWMAADVPAETPTAAGMGKDATWTYGADTTPEMMQTIEEKSYRPASRGAEKTKPDRAYSDCVGLPEVTNPRFKRLQWKAACTAE